ncbi:SPOR domain-containing protein [Sphingobium sp. V4]|uniref:tetratricopeptide repeat protein n=1 Tax=Sphingobium sp. V4 TaxID=3038927 RepID=UPI002557DB74|nr:tetratricopeptide repeat protein [Sphingobium sp. V4]WIW87459.1 SPOR domain-containing protein [Sphingobium sp. V4]
MIQSLAWILVSTVSVGGLISASPALAQTDQAQIARPTDAADLNTHLTRLASNPRDVAALIGAGEAALALDDPHGAAGFFARADAIESGNGRIKAGLARVMLKLQNPAEAARLFDQASRLGYPDTGILADRGLARDMTGDQAGAQRDYQAALARTPDDAELRRRYAASLGISGQVQGADRMLEPLLYKSDRAAWRYRAFIYAMNNRQAEAKKIADETMPAQLAAAITPYMQKMPYLTASQKAAAVHFGQFPAQTGTTIAAITRTPPAPGVAVAPKPPAVVVAAPATIPPAQAKPLSRAEQRRQQRAAARIARAEGLPTSRAVASAQRPPVPTTAPAQVAQAQTPPPSAARPAPSTPAAATAQMAPPPSARQPTIPSTPSPSVQGPPAPGFESFDSPPRPTPQPSNASSQLNAIALAQAGTPAAPPASQAAAPPPTQPPATESAPSSVQPITPVPPSPNPEATRTLADIIRAIDVPDTERQASVAAVDLNEIAALQAQRRAERQAAAKAAADKAKKEAATKAKAEADAKAKKEVEEKKRLAANPSRNWLQVGVGQSKSALGFTMKGLRRKYATLAPQDAWSASWSRTNRLLVGPFASFARAKELEAKLKAAGADVFAWKSDAGEVVEKLPGD